MNKVILFTAIICYATVASQSFMYILSLRNTQLALGAPAYIEVRQLIDANMNVTFRYVMYAALLSNLLLLIANARTPGSVIFIGAAISFLALLIDALLTLKGNMPLNQIINTWTPSDYPDNWREVRDKWFTIFYYRQLANLTGFGSLVALTCIRA